MQHYPLRLARTASSAVRSRATTSAAAAAAAAASRVMRYRYFATDWMQQAELEAIAATKDRALKGGNISASDHMMNKLTNEMDQERISNAMKLQDKLKILIDKCHQHKGAATTDNPRGRAVYSALRKKALGLRQDLISQKEAAGMITDAANVVEQAFPIPPGV
jgi:hypothetical protein